MTQIAAVPSVVSNPMGTQKSMLSKGPDGLRTVKQKFGGVQIRHARRFTCAFHLVKSLPIY